MSFIPLEECLVHTMLYGPAQRLEQVLEYVQTVL